MDAKRSMQAFAIYRFGMGIGLIVMPHVLLGLFGLSAGDDAWVRMVGMLALILGYYYLSAASTGLTQLYHWSVRARLFAAAFMIALYLTGLLSFGIVLLALVDIVAAAWTWSALRKEAPRMI